MELESNIEEVLKVDEDGFVCFSGRDYLKQTRTHNADKGLGILNKIINNLGERSAISQKLKQVITTTTKFYGTDQRIYIKVCGNKALGFIKVGERKLFYHDYVDII
jgi:alpha-tubulin N-acetyltransferase 1